MNSQNLKDKIIKPPNEKPEENILGHSTQEDEKLSIHGHILIGNKESSAVEGRINETGVSQTVTLSTTAMGREIDYKSNNRSLEENGSEQPILTFFSLDEKEETQIIGRTSRKENKGQL